MNFTVDCSADKLVLAANLACLKVLYYLKILMHIDARTLSLVIAFALLVTVYIWQAKKSNPALETSRWTSVS